MSVRASWDHTLVQEMLLDAGGVLEWVERKRERGRRERVCVCVHEW